MLKDPYKYFRVEARDLVDGLSQGLLELERAPPDKGLVGRLLRLAHTLKGAARVVQQSAIAELAHGIEEVLAPLREGQSRLPKERGLELFRLVDAIGAQLKAIEAVPRPQTEVPVHPAVEEPFRSVRVAIEEIDDLLDGMTEASVALDGLRKAAAPIDAAVGMARALGELLAVRRNGAHGDSAALRARALAERIKDTLVQSRGSLALAVERAQQELERAGERARELRLVPASTLFGAVERATRDAAESLRKRVRFEAAGGEHHLDAHVLAGLRDALLHLVRNAVAHGIEEEAERIAAGKPGAGLVQLQVERRGHQIAFLCRDDGRGFDLEAIREAALRHRHISQAEAAGLSLAEAVRLILRGGVTTTRTVTEISGRGIGLEVVREVAARLKGTLEAHTEAGRGTTVEIRVPISLAAIAALAVETAGRISYLPLDAVRAVLRVTPDEIVRSPEGDSVLHEGETIPFLLLSAILAGQGPTDRRSPAWPAAVLQIEKARVAVGVDRLLGTAPVVMKPLPPIIGAIPAVAGVCFDAEGTPQLVLDPSGLMAGAGSHRGGSTAPAAPRARPQVLVIDDSLTTRMLEQSILEAAGYAVDVAVSGEEGLEKARERPYALFVVDIEMPRMDGFEFIERTRSDPALREIPSILVSSRASPEDKRRGQEAGARAYIVKSEFDEARLLQQIHDLVSA